MTRTSERSTVIQIVTQLEPAGAQSVAAWLQGALNTPCKTVFLYEKAESELFPDPNLVVKGRPESPAGLLRFARASYQLRRSLGDGDTLIAHTHYAIVFAALLGVARRKRARMLAVHHSPEDRYPSVARLGVRAARSLRLIDDEVYCAASIAPPGATVIPNPVPQARTTRAVEPREVDVLIVARHSSEKSLDTAIRALPSMPDRTITFLGGGALTEELQQLASALGVEDRAIFLGRVPNERTRAFMAKARCVVLTSVWEALPMVLLEAVAEDAPLVVSDIPAHKFLEEAGAALAFTTKDPQSLADAIEKARTPEALQAMTRGRQTIKKDFSETATARAWDELIANP
ncbi:glycosyltransferase family 4 protein [Dermacoccus barathri]|uniref:Glycosyl transferase family 1 domain-containing protein n=1 Tax=Dermacoccus barathri TaxID=322601 RepID=A0ABN2B5N2_9MICO